MNILHKKKYTILATLSKYTFVGIIILFLFAPVFFVGACPDPTDPNCKPAAGNTNPPSTSITTGITNPLGDSVTDIPTLIKTIIGFVLLIGVPIITLAIIYAGFLFVTAQGNTETLKKAKETLLYTIIGAALLLGSYIIANAIQGTVNDIKSTT